MCCELIVASAMQVALDFIGKRGSSVGVAKAARIQYAREILQRELLPHIGIKENQETNKVPQISLALHCFKLTSALPRY